MAVVLVLAAALTALPTALVQFDLRGRSISTPDDLRALNDARTFVLQMFGGLAVAVGAYATWRRLRINEDELRATRDGQVTERFTRAIEQLGSDNTDVRIGAIFALARIADNSPTDRDAIIATLSAFVRGHSPWPPTRAGQPDDVEPADLPTLATRANDVQSAVAVLGRIPSQGAQERIRLPHTDLRRARMWQLTLDGALFGHADLRGARIWESSLTRADLAHADLRAAVLTNADLRGATLQGADLRGAELTDAALDGAQADGGTRWPPGFDAPAHGVIMIKDSREP